MGNPCLSFPPVTLNTYPLNSSPIESPATSWPIYPASAQVLSTCCWCRGRYSLVHECPQTTLIFDFDEFLGAIGRVSNLHGISALFAEGHGGGRYIKLHPARWAIVLTAAEVE